VIIFLWVVGFLFSMGLTLDNLEYNRDGAIDIAILAVAWPVVLGNQIRKKAGWRDDQKGRSI